MFPVLAPLTMSMCMWAGLLKVFQLAILALRQLQAAPDVKLQEQAVGLAAACLSYDFVGTCLDESSEDLGTIQVSSPSPLYLFDYVDSILLA